MNILKARSTIAFVGFLTFLAAGNSSLYALKEHINDGQASTIALSKSSSYSSLGGFKVHSMKNGFYFDIGKKRVNISSKGNSVFIREGVNIKEYYFSEKFMLSDNRVFLSKSQYNLLLNNIENSYARKIRLGKAIDRVMYNDYVTIYSDEDLTKPLDNVDVGDDIRVINTVLDGKFKVLTLDGKEGFIDTRFVRILDESLPPHVDNIDVNSDYIITVSQDSQNMKVYLKDKNDKYKLLKQSDVSTGIENEHTPNGIFTVKQNRGPWFFSERYQSGAKYFVEFRGNYLFHSLPYTDEKTIDQLESDKIGSKSSTGCIRLPINFAKWVYENIPADTLVIIDNVDIDLDDIVNNKNI